jgi:cation transport ATPase
MEEEILKKIEMQEKKLEEIQRSIESIKKYFLWTLIITVALIVLPLLGLLLFISKFLNIYSGGLNF